MKKLILALALVSTTALAGGPHRHGNHWDGRHYTHGHWRHNHNHGKWEWVVPAIIGGVIVYQVTKPPEPAVVEQQTIIVDSGCSPWTEVMNPDGSITRTRTCVK